MIITLTAQVTDEQKAIITNQTKNIKNYEE